MREGSPERKKPLLRIGELLKERNWSNQQLADRMGVSRQYVSDIVAERKGVSVNALVRIAGVLEVPVALLFADSAELLDSVRATCPNCGCQVEHDLCPSAFELVPYGRRWNERLQGLKHVLKD